MANPSPAGSHLSAFHVTRNAHRQRATRPHSWKRFLVPLGGAMRHIQGPPAQPIIVGPQAGREAKDKCRPARVRLRVQDSCRL